MRDTLNVVVERRLAKNLDVTLLLAALALVIFGCVMVYSAGKGSNAASFQKQVMWAVIGLVFAVLIASIDHTTYTHYAGKIYIFTLVMLVAVLVIGSDINGARSWIKIGSFTIQPSEFSKIAMIICLAAYLVQRQEAVRGFGVFVNSFIYIGVPLALVLREPDLGTCMVMVAIWLTMLFVAGTDVKYILLFFGGVALLGVIAWNVPHAMKSYQKQRVMAFINPGADTKGGAYNVNQSRIAIGSGKMFGKGFLKGTQHELRFIPEQHTDFIFAVVGEETGFVGASFVLLMYSLVIWRALAIVSVAEDSIARLIGAGIVGMFMFHIVENIGMTIGIMPCTGIPLPMISYGGSALMANMMGIGMLEGISMRRHKISF